MIFAFPHTATLIKRVKSGTDSFGNDVYTPTRTDVPVVFVPGASVEQVQGMDVLTVQPKLFLEPDTDVSAVDAIEVDGATYEVDGSPNNWTHPGTGWRAGLEVNLRRVTG